MARRFGANVTLDPRDAGSGRREIKRLTGGRGVDVAIEALGHQETFENALRAIRPGGTLSSLGVYSGKLVAPYEAFYAGLGDQQIVTTLCPGGKERMRRLMAMVATARRSDAARHASIRARRHRGSVRALQQQGDGVMKVALYPTRCPNHWGTHARAPRFWRTRHLEAHHRPQKGGNAMRASLRKHFGILIVVLGAGITAAAQSST